MPASNQIATSLDRGMKGGKEKIEIKSILEFSKGQLRFLRFYKRRELSKDKI